MKWYTLKPHSNHNLKDEFSKSVFTHLTEIKKKNDYKNEKSAGLGEEICSFHVVECLLSPALL